MPKKSVSAWPFLSQILVATYSSTPHNYSMCGIGLVHSTSLSDSQRTDLAHKMVKALLHRGPDAQEHSSPAAGLQLVHTRLSIMDLSPAGRQPMKSPSGRWHLIFNGEIYNHLEVRESLFKSNSFKGSSDTETILFLIEQYGFVASLQYLRGMFAIAAYDQETQQIFLARDRIGEKPLYYGFVGSDFMAGSELKVFHQHPQFEKQIDIDSLSQYLRFNNVPQPQSIYRGIHKLPQAHYLIYDLRQKTINQPTRYWQIPSVDQNLSQANLNEIENKLKEVIKIQMRSDVPYGCFLSGGVDSSLVTALMQTQMTDKVKTFSIGFTEEKFNEAVYAKRVAQHLGTDHTEWIISPQEGLAVIDDLASIYDEPFADSSQLPTYLLSKMTKSHVTVSLSGDGGDELFGGYLRYAWTQKIWNFGRMFPGPFRRWLATNRRRLPVSLVAEPLWQLGVGKRYADNIEDLKRKLRKTIGLFAMPSDRDLFFHSLMYWDHPNTILREARELPLISRDEQKDLDILGFMLWHDQTHYLPDDIMVKVDRASMAVALETRAPFLDHELVEMISRLPPSVRVGAKPKQLLKDILYKYVPPEMIERPKMGFGIPLRSWMQNEMKEQMYDLLSPDRIKRQGLFSPEVCQNLLDRFYLKKEPIENLLWPLLVFQKWHQHWQ